MSGLPCHRCRSECCYRVPVLQGEWDRLIQAVADWPAEEVRRLASQRRPRGMCPFVDVASWRCSVYENRPTLCRLYGYTPGLECPLSPEAASRMAREEAHGRMELAAAQHGEWAGTLGLDVTWREIRAALREAVRA